MAEVMKLGLILSATDKMSRVIDQAAGKSLEKLEKFQKGADKIAEKFAIAGGVITGTVFEGIRKAEDAAIADKRLEKVFKNLWGDSGAVEEAVRNQEKFASHLALQIGVDKETIKLTQAKLSTFHNVSSKTAVMSGVFERATKTAHDMAASGFGDAAINAKLLGIALEDPYNAIQRLKRTGAISDSDILRIKKITKSGGIHAGQIEILNLLEKKYKGVGEEVSKTSEIMKIGFEEVLESIGNVFIKKVDGSRVKLVEIIEDTTRWIDENQSLVETIAKVGVGLLATAAIIKTLSFLFGMYEKALVAFRVTSVLVGSSIKAMNFLLFATKFRIYEASLAIKAWNIGTKIATFGTWLLNGALAVLTMPITLVVLGIAALIAVIVICWKKFAVFRAVVKTAWETVKEFGTILKEYVLDRIKGIISGLGSIGSAIGLLFHGKFSAAYDEAKKGVRALSGYDAKMKAITRTKELATSISGKYSTILAKEREAEKPRSTQAIQNINTQNATRQSANSASLIYSPTIQLNGGGIQDKDSFQKLLNDHSRDFEQMLTRINNKNSRLSYSE